MCFIKNYQMEKKYSTLKKKMANVSPTLGRHERDNVQYTCSIVYYIRYM